MHQPHGMKALDEQERLIVRHLIRDPRESDNGIGEATGVNVRTVGRKRQKLEQAGILGYFTHLDLSSRGGQVGSRLKARASAAARCRKSAVTNSVSPDTRADARCHASSVRMKIGGCLERHVSSTPANSASTAAESATASISPRALSP